MTVSSKIGNSPIEKPFRNLSGRFGYLTFKSGNCSKKSSKVSAEYRVGILSKISGREEEEGEGGGGGKGESKVTSFSGGSRTALPREGMVRF